MSKVSGICTAVSVFCLGMAGRAAAQTFVLPMGSLKHAGCADVSAASFTPVTLVNQLKAPGLTEPVRFEVAKDGRVFFAERNGGVRVVQTDGSIVKLGTVPVNPLDRKLNVVGHNELGLTGMALSPDFDRTGLIYLAYQPHSPDIMKISRFKVAGTTLLLDSEQVLLSFPLQKNYCCHTGGDMQFDHKGDLWISVGNNTMNPPGSNVASSLAYVDESDPDKDDQAHAANTNDYRGKILRIHPLAAPGADGKLYTIPAGNLREAYSSLWTAAERAKVLPEIYTMGHRSNFTLSVDTVTGWLAWGDIGPDEARATEEFNVTAKPGFFGWPYFAGERREGADTYAYRLGKDENSPMNLSVNNTGAKRLPPAVPATFGYKKSAAIAGPIYRWDSRRPSPKKLPPHFDGKWFMADFNAGQVHVATLDASARLTGRTGLIQNLTRPLQIKIGPDGLLYTLEYAATYFTTDSRTAIKRWEYTGPACAGPVGLAAAPRAGSAVKAALVRLGAEGLRSVLLPPGANGLRLVDLRGRLAWESPTDAGRTAEARSLAVPAAVGDGVFRAIYRF